MDNKNNFLILLLCGLFSVSACNSKQEYEPTAQQATAHTTTANKNRVPDQQQSFHIQPIARFNEPWALAILPDQRLLITERRGQLQLFDPATKHSTQVSGIPKVAYAGQGGLGDIVLHPDFSQNHWVYYSYAEAGAGGKGAVVARAQLDLSQAAQPALKNTQVIWRQVPKVSGEGHYGHRLAFDRSGHLWVSSGERQKFAPAQDLRTNLGKILRLDENGQPLADNPFAQQGGIAAEIWSLGHRNPLGMAFDPEGQLWVVEMGPKGGDELNRIMKGKNYGYPLVSNGNHYDGTPIPNHATRPEFQAPELSWTPVISPSSLIIYRGQQLPGWQHKALIGGLSSKALMIVDLQQKPVQEIQRIDMKQRIRGLQEAQDGSIWIIEDGKNARLLQLSAAG